PALPTRRSSDLDSENGPRAALARRLCPASSTRYIGLDVHSTSCTAAIVDARGKHVGKHVIETNGQALVESSRRKPVPCTCASRRAHKPSGWSRSCRRTSSASSPCACPSSRGPKSDAFSLAEYLRT